MKHPLYILSLAMMLLASGIAKAQTPFDAFSPETSRPILDGDSIAAWRAEQKADTILCAIVADLRHEQLLLVDLANKSVLAYAPFTEELKNWMSVDPLADKYPNVTPYLYCNANPVMLVDPDGRAVVVNEDGQILGVVENDDRTIYYAANDWTEKQGTNNLEKVGLMIGRSSNEFYQTLKDNNLPAIGLFCSQASISFDFSIGIQGGWKFESGPFKGLSLMVNLVSADLFSIDIPLDFFNLDILFDKETNLNYIGKNGLKKISQELSLGCVVGIGLGQEFTTKGYGYNSQNS